MVKNRLRILEKEMNSIYNAIKNNRLLTAGIVGIGIYVAGVGSSGYDVYHKQQVMKEKNPEYIERFLDVDNKINSFYNKQITLGQAIELANPAFRDSLETTLNGLKTERDSLRALPNFQKDMNYVYNKIERINKIEDRVILKMVGSTIIAIPSILFFALGLYLKKNRDERKKLKEEK